MEYKKYSKTIKVNGNIVEAEVTIEVSEEEYDGRDILLDQDFESEAQEKAYIAKIDSGRIFCGNILVTARAEGLEGFDSLGGCELRPNNMFNSDPFEKSVNSYLIEHSMEETALDSLKKSLQEEYRRLLKQADLYAKFAGEEK